MIATMRKTRVTTLRICMLYMLHVLTGALCEDTNFVATTIFYLVTFDNLCVVFLSDAFGSANCIHWSLAFNKCHRVQSARLRISASVRARDFTVLR